VRERTPSGEPRWVFDVVGSALSALLAFGAVPAVLLGLVGDPLQGGLGHQWGSLARETMAALAVVAWLSWAACCIQLARSVATHVRRGHTGLPVDAPFGERVAARIAAGLLALSALGVPIAFSPGAGAARPSLRPVGVTTPARTATASGDMVLSAVSTYVVRPGDSLWSIADARLGDGADWTAISALNLGHTMTDGSRFIDPSAIRPGWTLALPTTAVPAAFADATTPDSVANGAALRISFSHHSPVAGASPADHRARPVHAPSAPLPELMVLGLGAIGCAALARRSRRLRLLRHLTTLAVDLPHEPSAGAADASSLIDRFLGLPLLEAFEAANCALAEALWSDRSTDERPTVRAVCVGADGIDFWLSQATELTPPGFSRTANGQTWHVDHRTLRSTATHHPYLPMTLPIGDDDDGTWLVPLQPGTCLPLLGPQAEALWHAARPVQEAWSWAPMVTVTDDPAVVTRELQCYGPDGTLPGDAPLVLFWGDPAELPPAIRPLVAVVTTRSSAATDVAVLVDTRAASIHPLNRTVRPHLGSPPLAAAIPELMAPPAPSIAKDSGRSFAPERIDQSQVALGPGIVEVRLLTLTPRLDGLREELPANRARRAVELVAYLALHGPDDVTSDRLRTRVLGSTNADAASKTLFNTATAARRAMGADTQGRALFPPGSRVGHYRLSEAVSVDVVRAAKLAALGSAAEDPDLAMAHLRAALDLIEGEPLGNVLSGYTWWEAEGHGARIAAVLVNAAMDLAALSVEAGLFDLARWGLERARLLDPYSEALSRAAMQVAAAAGDADRLRHEWRECQRRMDELDPGSTPSPRTERLYGELAERVLVGQRAG
jgi:DNA-binding SARP family transcriptional activator